ncbi:MAG: hypothetical protein LBI67_05570 [Treponema sp.]|jgi:hypothetical protein|nr:hypothetical protein [Treponema sp.]
MSKIDKAKEAQQGYLAARLAVEKIQPEDVVIQLSYKVDCKDDPGQKKTVYPGRVGYDVKRDLIFIKLENDSTIHCDLEVAHLIINALRELTE